MQAPLLRWQGRGYFDCNTGRRPLERDFLQWNWSRGEQSSKTGISYAVTPVTGEERTVALTFSGDGRLEIAEAPAPTVLPRSGWRIERLAHSEERATLIRTLEDTPFYARSLLQLRRNGKHRLLMHESLDLVRFSSAWVRTLLPFRMPRRS